MTTTEAQREALAAKLDEHMEATYGFVLSTPDRDVLLDAALHVVTTPITTAPVSSQDVLEIVKAVETGNLVHCGVCMGHSPSWDGHLRGCRGWAIQRLQDLAVTLSILED